MNQWRADLRNPEEGTEISATGNKVSRCLGIKTGPAKYTAVHITNLSAQLVCSSQIAIAEETCLEIKKKGLGQFLKA